MSAFDLALLAGGGLAAGVVNTLAGGGSLLTVPLLVLVGLPGTTANGTNRLGILLSSCVAVWRFRAEGVSELRSALPVLAPVGAGSLAGAALAARVPDDTFERAFGVVMLALVFPLVRGAGRARAAPARPWSRATTAVVFLGIGLYGGAVQAGLGIVMLFALTRAGFDLVRANAFKVVVNSALALVALPVFVLEERVVWLEGSVLALGFALGGAAGARMAVRGGERVIRPVLLVSVVALAGHMLGLY